MRAVLSGEHRRAAIMGLFGAAAIVALLVFRLFGGGESSLPVASPPPVQLTTPVPPAGATAPTGAVPAPAPPVDPGSLRDPFCPLVTAPAAPTAAPASPGSGPAAPAPVVCRRQAVQAGRQAVGLADIFVERDVRLARISVGQFTFPNLHEGEAFAGSFRVLTLSERCGEFDFEGKPFSLCEGEQAFK